MQASNVALTAAATCLGHVGPHTASNAFFAVIANSRNLLKASSADTEPSCLDAVQVARSDHSTVSQSSVHVAGNKRRCQAIEHVGLPESDLFECFKILDPELG
jgi:hypothetical protein